MLSGKRGAVAVMALAAALSLVGCGKGGSEVAAPPADRAGTATPSGGAGGPSPTPAEATSRQSLPTVPPGRSPGEVPDTPGPADTTAQRGSNSAGSAGVAAGTRAAGQSGSGTTGGLSPNPAPPGAGSSTRSDLPPATSQGR